MTRTPFDVVSMPLLFALLAGGCVGGCVDVPEPPSTQVTVQAVFDPAASPPDLPRPTDMARDPGTGLLKVPIADPGASPAQAEFDAYLNTLDGFPASSPVEVQFSGEVNDKTVTRSTILALEIPDLKQPKPARLTDLTLTYKTHAGAAGATRGVVQIRRAGGWKRGTSYAFFVLGGAAGVKDKQGHPVTRALPFELAAATHPLCVWDSTRAWDSAGMTCAAPGAGQAAAGCCTFNYSALIELQIKGQQGLGDPDVLSAVTALERARRTNATLLQLAEQTLGVEPDDVVVLWSFSTTAMAEIRYDPTAGVIPFPNDLLLDSKTGKVALPAPAGESAAGKALREGLNTLDGFATQGSSFAQYLGKIDPTSLQGGAAALIDLASGSPVAARIALDPAASAVTVTPAAPLVEQTRYAVVLVSALQPGSTKPRSGLRDSQGRRVAAAPFTALLRSRGALYDQKSGKSLVTALDGAAAKEAETARLAHKALFDRLQTGLTIARQDVVAAWTFTTQSVTAPLIQLRALPYKTLAALDGQKPTLSGALDTSLAGFPAGVPSAAIGGWIPGGSFKTWIALDEAKGTLRTDPSAGGSAAVRDVPFMLTVPQGAPPAGGWPLVVFQHGFNRTRQDLLALANTLAAAGYAGVAFDAIYHGARSWCTKDVHCQGAVTCNVSDGTCSGGAKLADSDGDGIPEANGAHFMNTANPFAVRDNARQHVVDTAALLRAVQLGGATGVSGGTLKLDAKQVHFIGHSLGAMLETLVLAVESLPARGVLAAPGAPIAEILLSSPAFMQVKAEILAANTIQGPGLEALRLAATLQWILDGADPGNLARYVTTVQLDDPLAPGGGAKVAKKQLLIQLAEKDQVIPLAHGSYLAQAASVAVQKSTYAGQGHAFLLKGDPSLAATSAAQLQAVTFLKTGQICTPDLTVGTCK